MHTAISEKNKSPQKGFIILTALPILPVLLLLLSLTTEVLLHLRERAQIRQVCISESLQHQKELIQILNSSANMNLYLSHYLRSSEEVIKKLQKFTDKTIRATHPKPENLNTSTQPYDLVFEMQNEFTCGAKIIWKNKNASTSPFYESLTDKF